MFGFLSTMRPWVLVVLTLLGLFTIFIAIYFIYILHLGKVASREQEKAKMYIMQAGIEKKTAKGIDEACSSSTDPYDYDSPHIKPPPSPAQVTNSCPIEDERTKLSRVNSSKVFPFTEEEKSSFKERNQQIITNTEEFSNEQINSPHTAIKRPSSSPSTEFLPMTSFQEKMLNESATA